MAPYLAVFVGEQGQQVTCSLYTEEEFRARANIPGTKWAVLLSMADGIAEGRFQAEQSSSEKTA